MSYLRQAEVKQPGRTTSLATTRVIGLYAGNRFGVTQATSPTGSRCQQREQTDDLPAAPKLVPDLIVMGLGSDVPCGAPPSAPDWRGRGFLTSAASSAGVRLPPAYSLARASSMGHARDGDKPRGLPIAKEGITFSALLTRGVAQPG